MYSFVDIVIYYVILWKVIMVVDKLGELLEYNDIIQNLNFFCEIIDMDWIRFGKIMCEMIIIIEGVIVIIDFCVIYYIFYMLFDW